MAGSFNAMNENKIVMNDNKELEWLNNVKVSMKSIK